ncbi:MAG: ArsR family transcriptional regulator [Euryarchaeota archaeon]|nr:ArsR family transcriptional regulator [Euryarchaeota archaeon]
MILRDKSSITKTLILLELIQGKKKLKEIAKNIDITVQGVSEYLKSLEREGLVKDGEITLKGWEFLDHAISEMGDFVHSAQYIINRVNVTEAIAGENIKKGERVGLVMENGYLHAYHRESSSTGLAINSAKKGEDVGITDLRGILTLEYGKIVVYSLPSVEEGGTRKLKKSTLKKTLEKYEGWKIGVCGVVAALALKNHHIDFEFSAANAAVDAYYRGISTVIFASHERVPSLLETLQKKGVKYTLKSME